MQVLIASIRKVVEDIRKVEKKGNQLVNAVITLVAVLPRLASACRRALGYGVYNYAYYLLGASLNVFFPLYVAAVVLAGITLILALSQLGVPGVAGT